MLCQAPPNRLKGLKEICVIELSVTINLLSQQIHSQTMGSLASLKRSSAFTIIGVFAFLSFLFLLIIVAIDYFLAFPFFPLGLLVLVSLSALFILLQWLISSWAVKRAAGIREEHFIDQNSNPFVYNTVKELCDKAGIPMPRIAVIPNQTPNAFVFGRTTRSSLSCSA